MSIPTQAQSILDSPAFLSFRPVPMPAAVRDRQINAALQAEEIKEAAKVIDSLCIPDQAGGFFSDGPGRLVAASKTRHPETGARHLYVIPYGDAPAARADGGALSPLSCGLLPLPGSLQAIQPERLPCVGWGRHAACRHLLGADTLLNLPHVAGMLRTAHAGQTDPCDITRAWEVPGQKCFGCGSPVWYVHLYRPVAGGYGRANDRNEFCTNRQCGLWKHMA